jgi:hypothetical protein
MIKIHGKTRERRRESGLLDDVVRCSKCDQPNDRAPQRYCRACKNEYARLYNKKFIKVPRDILNENQIARLRRSST